jgi:hypothetical protein
MARLGDYNYLFRLLLGAGCSVAEADRVARECMLSRAERAGAA